MPNVTIITICYRNPGDLRRTLDSLAALDSIRFQRLVIDGSPDESCEAISADFLGVEHHRSPDSGKYDAMNKGIALAAGDTLLFMNSGDVLVDAAAFDAAVAANEAALATTLFYGDAMFDIDGVTLAVPAPAIAPASVAKGVLPSHQAILIPADFHRCHSYDDSMHFAADTKLLKQAFAKLPAVHLPFPIARFAYGGVSNSPGRWGSIARQLVELREAHELTMRETVSTTLLLVRRKLLQAVFGEAWFRRVQRNRLVTAGRARILTPPSRPAA